MDTATFIASLVGSLAWPVAAVVLALIFREPIGRIVDRLPKRVKAGPFEMEWPEVAARVALAAGPAAGARRESSAALSERLRELALSDPGGAIREAYDEVEKALRDRLRQDNVNASQIDRYLLVDEALGRGVINGRTADSIRGLIILRDLAGAGVDVEKAVDYLTLADAVVFAIETWRPSIPTDARDPR